MGNVIVFRPARDKTRLKPPPEGAKIVAFTGGWHMPMCKEKHPAALKKTRWHENFAGKFSDFMGLLGACAARFLRQGSRKSPSGIPLKASQTSHRSIPAGRQSAARLCSKKIPADGHGLRQQSVSGPATLQIREG